jgi:hypothetical protein
MQVLNLNLYAKSALSLSQLRLVPKVGQWGQLCVRVFRYNKFTIKSNQTTQTPKIRITYKIIQVTTKRYKDTIIQDIQDRINHTLGPSMPQVALTLLGLPSLASTHSSTQG